MQQLFHIENGTLLGYSGKDTAVRIPENVHTIGPGVFRGFAWLTEVILPSGLKTIEAEAFKGCGKLENLQFPEGLTSIGAHAFQRCNSFTQVNLPVSLSSLGICAFRDCGNLETLHAPGIRQFPKEAFASCVKLATLEISPDIRLSSLKNGVLDGCLSLRQIAITGGEIHRFDSVENALNHPDFLVREIAGAVLHSFVVRNGELTGYTGNQKELVLPEIISSLGHGCLAVRRNLTEVFCPGTLRSIGTEAFADCSLLESIHLKSTGIFVAPNAFYRCQKLQKIIFCNKCHTLEEAFQEGLLVLDPDAILKEFYLSGKRLMQYWGNDSTVRIPEGVETLETGCFENNMQLQTVILPESVRRINSKAFRNCHKLKRLEMNNQSICIAVDAFEGCEKLANPLPQEEIAPAAEVLTAKNAHNAIAPYANCNAKDLTHLRLEDLDCIGAYAYAHCPNLESVEIIAPNCVISSRAFSQCSGLKHIRIHAKQLGKGVFSYCRNLETIEIQGVEILGEEAFAGCENLHHVNLTQVHTIAERCFDECISLKTFDFSEIWEIRQRAFERCDGLTQVCLNRGKVGYRAFADCAGLKSIHISDSVQWESAPFFGCTQIREIHYNGNRYPTGAFIDGLNYAANPLPEVVRELISGIYACFDVTQDLTIQHYRGCASACTIPEGICRIGSEVFRNATRLTQLKVPESVSGFGKQILEGTPWLAEKRNQGMVILNHALIDGRQCEGKVVIPDDVTQICKLAFDGNTDITSLVLKNGNTQIEASAFRNCFRLTQITTADGRTYCSHSPEEELPTFVRNIFKECTEAFEIDSSGTLLRANGNIPVQYLPEKVRVLSQGVFRSSRSLEQLELTPKTQVIEANAFCDSKWLKAVTGGSGISRIGESAFDGCKSLEEIELSENLSVLEAGCFRHCCNLRKINLSGPLEHIPSQAFFRCKSLKRIILPASVKRIEKEAFALCTGLEEVVFLGGRENADIHPTAFAWCEKLREVDHAL